MSEMMIHGALSTLLLALGMIIALKKRRRLSFHVVLLAAGIFWMPVITVIAFIKGNVNQGWYMAVISMGWIAMNLIAGLCIMYGSKTIHCLGRDLILLTVAAVALLLSCLLFW